MLKEELEKLYKNYEDNIDLNIFKKDIKNMKDTWENYKKRLKIT